MQKNKKIKRRKKSGIAKKLFILILLYMAYIIILSMFRPKVGFYEVVPGSIVKDTKHTGIILRNEKVTNTNIAGNINFFVRESRHVSVDQDICAIDGNGSLTKFIKDNKLDDLAISEADLKKVKNELSLFSTSYDDNNFIKVYDSKDMLKLSLLEYTNIASYETLEEKLKDKNIQYTRFKAQDLGIVSFKLDGMETLNQDNISKDIFDKSKYKSQYIKTGDRIDENKPIYKTITDENWSIIFPIDDNELKEYEDKNILKIKFLSKNLELKAKYSTFSDKNGNKYAKLDFDSYVINFISDRYIDFEIESKNATGLKIPEKAVIEKEFFTIPKDFISRGGSTNSLGFNKETYIDNKESIQFVLVDIYAIIDDKYYISTDKESALKEGDTIVSIKTNDKYKIGEKASLKGVYNINKGYAIFKYIEILADNEEYYTISKETDYGLSAYDHILVDPKRYNEKDFIYQ